MDQKETTKIAIFKGKGIRKSIYKNEWWFSIIDIVEALTGTDRPRKYWNDLKTKLIREGYAEVSEKIGQLKIENRFCFVKKNWGFLLKNLSK